MSTASKTIYGQIIEYRKGKHISLLISVKVYSVTPCRLQTLTSPLMS